MMAVISLSLLTLIHLV